MAGSVDRDLLMWVTMGAIVCCGGILEAQTVGRYTLGIASPILGATLFVIAFSRYERPLVWPTKRALALLAVATVTACSGWLGVRGPSPQASSIYRAGLAATDRSSALRLLQLSAWLTPFNADARVAVARFAMEPPADPDLAVQSAESASRAQYVSNWTQAFEIEVLAGSVLLRARRSSSDLESALAHLRKARQLWEH